VPVAQGIRGQYRTEVAELENFDALCREAHDKPWWRAVIKAARARRESFLNQLVMGGLDQRDEDKLRGQILELNFFIILDENGSDLVERARNEERNNGR
jgi:hypothetical protein